MKIIVGLLTLITLQAYIKAQTVANCFDYTVTKKVGDVTKIGFPLGD
jgi:hypothetical protein